MVDLFAWLKSVERMAADCYAASAKSFAQDVEFSRFLSRMSQEETEHLELLETLEKDSSDASLIIPSLTLDDDTRHKVESPFARIMTRLNRRDLTKQEMVSAIVEAEFCEWNEIFLFVVDALKGFGKEFQKAVAEIDHHRQEIVEFITDQPGGKDILNRFGRLQQVWIRRILVVEDDPAIAMLIKVLLSSEAEVVVSSDGEEGLEHLRGEFFDAVISDIEMPRLDGVELYRQAVEIDRNLLKRFVFFSGTKRPEYLQFVKSSGVTLLKKPSPMSSIRKAVDEVVKSNGSP